MVGEMTGWVNASLSTAVFKGLTVALHQLFGIEQWKAARSRLAICSMTSKLWHFITASSSSISLSFSLFLFLAFSVLFLTNSVFLVFTHSLSRCLCLSPWHMSSALCCLLWKSKSRHLKTHGSTQPPFPDMYTVINMFHTVQCQLFS